MHPATRRPRGTETTGMFLRVERDVKATLDDLSARTGLGKAVIVERLVEALELDEHGRPVGWPETQQQEEVPVRT